MKDNFNLKWGIIFFAMFFFIMIPFPWFFTYEYVPSIWGLPNYIVSWFIFSLVNIVLVVTWCRQALKRPEYHEFDEEDK